MFWVFFNFPTGQILNLRKKSLLLNAYKWDLSAHLKLIELNPHVSLDLWVEFRDSTICGFVF